MSHIVEIKTEVRDRAAVEAACRRLKLELPTEGTARMFEGEAAGLIVKLPGWQYPVVIDTASGEAKYDNYGGRWGAQSKLDALLQAYAVEKARLEARRSGHTVYEQPLADGSIRLTVQTAGEQLTSEFYQQHVELQPETQQN